MDNNVFPIPFYFHLVFAVIAAIVFIVQYSKHKRAYQMFMCAAVAASLLLYINPGRAWHNCVGVIELLMYAGAIITAVMSKSKNKAAVSDVTDNAAKTDEDEKQDKE